MEPTAERPIQESAAPSIETDAARAAALFRQSVEIMTRLRAPDGCPWDREQNFDSIRRCTLEEMYEVFDAIEQRDYPHLAEELGDLLLQVLFYAEMAANAGHFTMAEVLEELNRKLVRRHPHVFGEEASRAAGNAAKVNAKVEGSSANVLRNWDQIKVAENAVKGKTPQSRLDGVIRAMPALAEAAKLGQKAAKAGFDWPDWRGLLEKIDEETGELVAEIEAVQGGAARQEAMAGELGDLLFTVVNLGRHLGVDPEQALKGTNLRFRQRFRQMELGSALPLEKLSLDELESLWQGAKKELARRAAEVAPEVQENKKEKNR
jgi:MazG family protein